MKKMFAMLLIIATFLTLVLPASAASVPTPTKNEQKALDYLEKQEGDIAFRIRTFLKNHPAHSYLSVTGKACVSHGKSGSCKNCSLSGILGQYYGIKLPKGEGDSYTCFACTKLLNFLIYGTFDATHIMPTGMIEIRKQKTKTDDPASYKGAALGDTLYFFDSDSENSKCAHMAILLGFDDQGIYILDSNMHGANAETIGKIRCEYVNYSSISRHPFVKIYHQASYNEANQHLFIEGSCKHCGLQCPHDFKHDPSEVFPANAIKCSKCGFTYQIKLTPYPVTKTVSGVIATQSKENRCPISKGFVSCAKTLAVGTKVRILAETKSPSNNLWYHCSDLNGNTFFIYSKNLKNIK